jgi:sulfhydrogenase subunit alpha
VTGPLRDLRRLAYCGEWIESHVLHAAMLHAPDFLGVDDAFAIAKSHPGVVEAALQLKKLGNALIEVTGGRAVHPVNFRVGGFYRAPRKDAVRALIERLEWGVEAAVGLTRTFAGFDFPDYTTDDHFVSLRHPDEYAIHEGRIVGSRGLDIAVADFRDHVTEEHVARSNALHGKLRAGGLYQVGPLARYNNNFHQLSDLARQTAREAGLGPACTNPFQSLLVRMVEVVYACEEALRLARAYEEPDRACVTVTPGAGEGHGCTEAPRGICYHWYRLDGDGRIAGADIIPPTSQNQPQIEADLRGIVEANLALDDDALRRRCEQSIRNYDPCISCATHFLDLRMDRG